MKVGRSVRLSLMISLLAAMVWLATSSHCAASSDAPASTATLDKADNAWLLVSSALVLMMTGPGLALFYCGLVRKKNVLSVMMQCIFLMCLLSVVWAVYGYSLSFGGNGAVIGDSRFVLMNNAESTWVEGTPEQPGHAVTPLCDPKLVAANVPVLSHMLFQGMFFVITPALICGAFAERMKFSTMVVFMVLWGTLIYCPLCHWVWGNGLFTYGSEHAKTYCAGGALDFAGGTVVHISSGVTALICACCWASVWATAANRCRRTT